MILNDIGKKNNQTSVSYAGGEIPTLGSTDNAGNLVNLVSGIIHLPFGLEFLCLHQRPMKDSICLRMGALTTQLHER